MLNEEYIKSYLNAVAATAQKLLFEDQTQKINKIIDTLFLAWCSNQPVYIMGNGGSASTASHFAADLSKTLNDKPGHRGLRALTPWDNVPLISAIVNDRLKEDFFTTWLNTYYQPYGIGIGISVHGGSGSDFGGQWSQNLLRGLQYIKDHGGKTIGLSGFDGGPMEKLVDTCVVVPASSTPLVESFHVILHHLIAFRLKELIEDYEKHMYDEERY